MRLTLRELEVFTAVANAGSATAAGDKVGLTQSAVSQALDKLEQSLGVKLFDRIGRRLLLNADGRRLLPEARALLASAGALETLFDVARPVLRLGASTTIGNYLLPSALAAFRLRYPGAQLEVQVANTRDIVAAVLDFSVDCGFIEGPCHHPALRVTPWQQDELVIFAAAHHPMAGRRLGGIELATAEWILREAGSGTREEVENLLLPHLSGLNLQMELGDSEAIKRTVAAGFGVSCLSRRVVAEWLNDGRLVQLDCALPPLVRTLWRIERHERAQPRGLALFLQSI